MTWAAKVAKRTGRPYRQVRALPLAHHWPEEYERCQTIAGRHVCRRCLVSWPTVVVVAVAALAGASLWPERWDIPLLLLLPLPAFADFAAEQAGKAAYSPVRQAVLAVPCAVAFGVGFARYAADPSDTVFWGVCVAYGVACAAVMAYGSRRGQAA